MGFEPHVRQIEEKSDLGRLEEAAQPHRLGHLAVPHVKEARDVLHDERLVEPRLQHVGVGHETRQEFLGVERREDVVEVVGAVLGVQALEMLGDPRRAIQLRQGTGALNAALVQGFGELAEIVVEEEGVALLDLRPPRIVGARRVGHREMVDALRLGELAAEVGVVEGADLESRHQTSVLRLQ